MSCQEPPEGRGEAQTPPTCHSKQFEAQACLGSPQHNEAMLICIELVVDSSFCRIWEDVAVEPLSATVDEFVAELKALVVSKRGRPFHELSHVCFLYRERAFQGDGTLSDWGIQEGSEIRCRVTNPDLRLARALFKFSGRVLNMEHESVCKLGAECPLLKTGLAYAFSQEVLDHVSTSYHGAKKHCCYGDQCRAHQRLIAGGFRLDDRCHELVFAHPPRSRTMSLPDGFNPFVSFNTRFSTDTRKVQLGKVKRGERPCEYVVAVPESGMSLRDDVDYVDSLLEEVTRNGYGHELQTPEGLHLLDIVREARNYEFHRSIGAPLNDGELLALLLYTGCDCNYAMTKCLLQDDHETWAVFDYTLSLAIAILTFHSPCQEVPLYTGLRNVYVESTKPYISSGPKENGCPSCYLKAHTSFSTKRDVSLGFRGCKGSLITVPPQFFAHHKKAPSDSKIGGMAPVSWISKFGDNEAEVLCSRFTFFGMSLQQLSFMDGCQEVELTWMDNYALATPTSLLGEHVQSA